ncbi:MAG: DUF58 domain-containing protein [Phycisphaerae bacterium]
MSASANYFRPEVLSKIAGLELRARRVVEGFVSGLHKSPYKGFSVEFADHRQYVPGDDVRHLDWRAYAKTDRLLIKEYEVETNLRTHIVLDCSGSMAYPEHDTGRMTKWDYAATLAACLAHLLLHQQDGVGLTLFDNAIRSQLPVSANRASLVGFIKHLEAARPDQATDTKMVFQHLAEQLPRRGLLVLISDLLTDFDDIINGFQRFRFSQHDLLVMHVLDADELEFPFTDQTLFDAMEGLNIEVRTDPQSLRRSYLEAVQSFISRLRGSCLNHGIDYVLLSTADPLDVALTGYLASRMNRQRSTV